MSFVAKFLRRILGVKDPPDRHSRGILGRFHLAYRIPGRPGCIVLTGQCYSLMAGQSEIRRRRAKGHGKWILVPVMAEDGIQPGIIHWSSAEERTG